MWEVNPPNDCGDLSCSVWGGKMSHARVWDKQTIPVVDVDLMKVGTALASFPLAARVPSVFIGREVLSAGFIRTSAIEMTFASVGGGSIRKLLT